MAKNVDKIYLVGFMGVGKSAIAFILSMLLGWQVIDLDALIEERTGLTISEIFAVYGEAHFRQIERLALLSILSRRRVIVAVGGGTFAGVENRHLMLCDGITVWLDAPLRIIRQRLKHADDIRPLARDRKKMTLLYNQRRRLYGQAEIHVSSTGSFNRVAQNVLRAITFLN